MKVAHLVPTLHPGGPETGLVDLAAAAPKAGLELMVVALSTTSDTTQVSALRRLGVPVAELGLAPYDPRAAGRMVRALRERGAELIHTHLPPAEVVGAAAALRMRVPVVSTLHHIENEPADRVDRLRRTARILARQRFMSRTVAISRTQREWYRGLGGPAGDIVVLPDGVVDPGPVDAAERDRVRTILDVGERGTLALSSAPMRRDAGHELLLDAVELIPAATALTVALAGDGPLRPWLESRVAASDALRDRVRFVHRGQDAATLLGSADLVLHTSASGALPTALLRAMAAGVPAVATRVGGVPEIVSADTGVLVPLQPGPIADAIVALAADPARRERLGTAARRRYLAEFEAVGWAQRLRTLYDGVLA
ncbi:glycosyltransferase [Pseudonocardia petroleophila]|uniref:Glycosyltransferase n=1 Tax=Pseudonocardia petroleophila TaxID=37331 RepID=A0A7G7MDE8_9PSEU|nr:glycosyltransferase [Pseudonocardia petroleophila]QNG50809.1 glycosyltransferase [Pseudonocardia petroleophila]